MKLPSGGLVSAGVSVLEGIVSVSVPDVHISLFDMGVSRLQHWDFHNLFDEIRQAKINHISFTNINMVPG